MEDGGDVPEVHEQDEGNAIVKTETSISEFDVAYFDVLIWCSLVGIHNAVLLKRVCSVRSDDEL